MASVLSSEIVSLKMIMKIDSYSSSGYNWRRLIKT